MDEADDQEGLDILKSISRQRIHTIWLSAQLGMNLEAEDALLAKIMRQHSEYADIWDRLDELSDEQVERDGTNPVVHIQIHLAVENQIALGEPKEVGEVFKALLGRGYSRHEAIHEVGSVLVEEIFDILREHRPHDQARYIRKVKRLPGRPPPRR